MEETKNRCILVMKMFTGDYLQESNNIGHEVINLFRADNGKHYIYAVPSGKLGKEWDGKVTDILLVRYIQGAKKLRILAKISGITPKQHVAKRKGKNDDKLQDVFQKAAKIKYGGKSLKEIFENNTYKNEADISSVPVTFFVASDQYKVPKENIEIVENHKGNGLSNVQFHQLMYFDSEQGANKKRSDYEYLSSIIDDGSIWKEDNTPKVNEISNPLSRFTFLTICRKEYNELAYSNMLAYYLEKNPAVMEAFVKEVLKLNNIRSPFTIHREYKNIDILIKSNDGKSIIIENKIKSDINGKTPDGHCQLDKYVEKLIKEEKGDGNITEESLLPNIYGFVLCPNYNILDINDYKPDEYMNRYKDDNGNSRIIKYSEVYDFFKRHLYDYLLNRTIGQNQINQYYMDFLTALYLHSKEVDTIWEDLTKERFVNIIKNNNDY